MGTKELWQLEVVRAHVQNMEEGWVHVREHAHGQVEEQCVSIKKGMRKKAEKGIKINHVEVKSQRR